MWQFTSTTRIRAVVGVSTVLSPALVLHPSCGRRRAVRVSVPSLSTVNPTSSLTSTHAGLNHTLFISAHDIVGSVTVRNY